jgi:hypothetical protein
MHDVERWRNEKNSLICHAQTYVLPLFLRSDVLSLVLVFIAVDFVLADLEYTFQKTTKIDQVRIRYTVILLEREIILNNCTRIALYRAAKTARMQT